MYICICTQNLLEDQNGHLQSPDRLPFGLVSDLVICKFWEELHVFMTPNIYPWDDRVSMLTHTYPHKPLRKIKVTFAITRLTARFPCGWMSDLVIWKHMKRGWWYMTPNIFTEAAKLKQNPRCQMLLLIWGVIKQHSTQLNSTLKLNFNSTLFMFTEGCCHRPGRWQQW